MIAKIIKITDDLFNSSEGEKLRSYSYNLPLFSTDLSFAYRQEFSQYVLQLWLVAHKYRYPAWINNLNQDQVNLINSYWNMVIEQNKDGIEFEV